MGTSTHRATLVPAQVAVRAVESRPTYLSSPDMYVHDAPSREPMQTWLFLDAHTKLGCKIIHRAQVFLSW